MLSEKAEKLTSGNKVLVSSKVTSKGFVRSVNGFIKRIRDRKGSAGG